MGDNQCEELERSSSENVTIVAETYNRAPTATVSSLKSQDSTEQLICATPSKCVKKKQQSVRSKSVEASLGSVVVRRRGRTVAALGLAQLAAGALLAGAGAAACVRGAALARVGAGLWAGAAAVVAGVVGLLAGINDCYGLQGNNGAWLSAFLALTLLSLACGNSAGVLAGTGLHRDYTRSRSAAADTFQEEMAAWTPVISNTAVLIAAVIDCLLCIITIYHLSKRICPCFRRKRPFEHNQFEPGKVPAAPYVITLDEAAAPRARTHELARDLEAKLHDDRKKEEPQPVDSASSHLVSSWLGRHPPPGSVPPGAVGGPHPLPVGAPRTRRGVRKTRPPPPVMLLPAHPASTMGRMPMGVMVPPRYATLPLPPYPAPVFYPARERMRRRRSPRAAPPERRTRRSERAKDSQLTRSLERIHRQRRVERKADADLKRTYTGLDRTYAEQFIAVCDESRSHAAERSDSRGTTSTEAGARRF